MVNKNDDRDRNGNKIVPQGNQGRDTVDRDRPMEEGRNFTNQGWPRESLTQDPVKRTTAAASRDSETRGNEK